MYWSWGSSVVELVDVHATSPPQKLLVLIAVADKPWPCHEDTCLLQLHQPLGGVLLLVACPPATGRLKRLEAEVHEITKLLISESQILTALRTSLNSTSPRPRHQPSTFAALPTTNSGNATPAAAKVKSYPIQLLDTLVTRHFRATQSAPLSLSGRHLSLIYLLVATLITTPQNKAVVVVDFDARFDITRVLQCAPHRSPPASEQAAPPLESRHRDRSTTAAVTHDQQVTVEDLRHVHVYRPARGSPSHIRDVLTSAEQHMVYSRHASVAREWWGTIVIGGGSPTVLGPGLADVTTGWKGWLRVDREEVRGFPVGTSVEEAMIERDQRQRAADAAGLTATCVWGGFAFDEAGGYGEQHCR